MEIDGVCIRSLNFSFRYYHPDAVNLAVPMWGIYPLLPRSADFQRKEIERIKDSEPEFVLISEDGLNGRDDLRFKNTNKLIYQYLVNNFQLLPNKLNGQSVYIKRGSSF